MNVRSRFFLVSQSDEFALYNKKIFVLFVKTKDAKCKNNKVDDYELNA